jgi:DNA-binding HxlR family transcriptional regulator
MRKETSTNYTNEKNIHDSCSMALTISLLSGRWKPSILWHLQHGALRYAELNKKLQGATERILVKQLHELEKDGLITREEAYGKPLKVTYTLSKLGNTLIPILQQIEGWGDRYKEAISATV